MSSSLKNHFFIALLSALAAVNSGGAAADASSIRASWSAETPHVLRSDLTFASGEARLSGTLYLPHTNRPSPVIVVFHGANDPLRTAQLYRHLISMLPPLGIGVFVYDRRGTGQSRGPSANGAYTVLADDGIAARKMLSTLPSVDAHEIGYWGLSQGGWLAALAATRDPTCAFAIAISAPMATADVQMRFAVGNILRIKGYDQHAINIALDARRAVDDYMEGKVDRKTAQRFLDRAIAQPWFDLIYMAKTFSDPDKSDWAREMRNDPLAVMSTIQIPILVLYGSADPWVPVTASLDRLDTLLAEHTKLKIAVIAGADHAMMTSASPLQQIDPKLVAAQSPEAPAYFAILAQWLTTLGIARND